LLEWPAKMPSSTWRSRGLSVPISAAASQLRQAVGANCFKQLRRTAHCERIARRDAVVSARITEVRGDGIRRCVFQRADEKQQVIN
jgi:hypothetical protein